MVRNEKKLLEEHGHEVFTYYRSNKELNEGNKLKTFYSFYGSLFVKTCREVKRLSVKIKSISCMCTIP